MGHATDQTPVQPTPATIPWPGTLDRYPTPASLTVDVLDRGPHTPWPYGTACHTCRHTDIHQTRDEAQDAAQAHAEQCTTPALRLDALAGVAA